MSELKKSNKELQELNEKQKKELLANSQILRKDEKKIQKGDQKTETAD